MSDLVKIELPFTGFYESWHDQRIHDAIESGFNYDYDTGDEKEITEEVYDAIFMADVNWFKIQEEYCKHWVEAFGDKFSLDVKFDELWSPKAYNFYSDRVYATIPREQINKIRKEVEKHEGWAEFVKEEFSDRSGFWSNYSSDHKDEDWTRETLDECQYEKIISYWIEHISDDVTSYWVEEEAFMTDDFEISNWDSIVEAQETIENYLKEQEKNESPSNVSSNS